MTSFTPAQRAHTRRILWLMLVYLIILPPLVWLHAHRHIGPAFSAEFLQSHPLTGKRAANFEAAFDPHATYQPALSRAQADALFDICGKPDKHT